MIAVNATHDPALRSWVGSANRAGTDFPIQNLPFGVFRRSGSDEAFRGGVAIGDQVLDLGAAALREASRGVVTKALAACGGEPALNSFMAMGREAWSALRGFLSESLRADSPHAEVLRAALVPQRQAEYALPARIGDYTDFYASIHHATAVGRLFRPDSPLLPNYKWVPIGYHGRA
jgi:fumarylacetoacetase